MATSPNYAWAEPDNSSLVKNGAADIRTLGDAIDTSVWNVGYGQAGKNKIINGNFGINQRGFSSASADGYGFDRWAMALSGGTATYSLQTFALGTAPVAGYEGKNFARVVATVGNDFLRLNQAIESVRTFAGQTMTLSFWAKGTNPTTAGNLKASVVQAFGTGGSPSATVFNHQNFVLTANWTRYSLTFNVASIAGKTLGTNNDDQLGIWFGNGADASTDSWTLDLWGVQVEYGSKATPFQTASGGSPQAELAMCQRYYYRTGGDSTVNPITMGIISAATTAQAYISVPVTMRIPPTSVEFSTLKVSGGAMGPTAVSAITLNQVGKTTIDLTVTCSGASFTNGAACIVQGNGSTSNYLGLSAEL
jgi:hypothetical protein